jgi:hypothetical protein
MGAPLRPTLGQRRVVDPSGASWRVGRAWVSRRAGRVKGRQAKAWADGAWDEAKWELPNWISFPDFGSVDSLEGAIVAGVALIVIVFVLIPIFLFGVELIVVGSAIAAGLVGRFLLGRPWVVTAKQLDGPHQVLAWEVSGWRRSRSVVSGVAEALAAGSEPIVDDSVRRLPAGATDH